LEKFVYICADDKEDAYNKIWDRWDCFDPQVVPTADDFQDIDFYVYDSNVE
jgi:hypothetical protein